MSLRDHLQDIYDRRGTLTPALVVDEARPKDHPLHSRFDWNNKTAGESWRRYQARKLIQSVTVTYRDSDPGDPAGIRQWQAVRSPDDQTSNDFTFRPAEEVASDPLQLAMVLRDMEREWKALRTRYGHFKEFALMIQRDLEGIPA